ncbi:SRPBCC domain-containing protein [Kineococcus sp. SYSU DK003]|uniref:SRPBCC domain-containing protein n=1 Tax=Kineococcus sp. SYSU DK003 TaxID=3383124 RepID=UPI003D7E6E58
MADTDRIEREITIAASAERVWELVSRPGWFVNDGELRDHELRVEGDVTVVVDPVHGEFRLRTETLEPPRYAAFRWLGEDGGSTLVEFHVADREGGVLLRVVESGFDSLPGTDVERRERLAENTEGWVQELDLARTVCEEVRVA